MNNEQNSAQRIHDEDIEKNKAAAAYRVQFFNASFTLNWNISISNNHHNNLL